MYNAIKHVPSQYKLVWDLKLQISMKQILLLIAIYTIAISASAQKIILCNCTKDSTSVLGKAVNRPVSGNNITASKETFNSWQANLKEGVLAYVDTENVSYTDEYLCAQMVHTERFLRISKDSLLILKQVYYFSPSQQKCFTKYDVLVYAAGKEDFGTSFNGEGNMLYPDDLQYFSGDYLTKFLRRKDAALAYLK